MNDETPKESSWLFMRMGRRDLYHIGRDDMIKLLEDHAAHVRRESIGDVYRRFKAMQRFIPIRYQPGFAEAVNATYAMLAEKVRGEVA